MNTYDAIVVGLGGMGSAALYHLAKRGLKVLGIEQFGIAHDRGSSHGETRIIRKAYFEHPDYVPLVESAYRHWFDLEQACGQELFRKTGLIIGGPEEGTIVSGVRRAAASRASSTCSARAPAMRATISSWTARSSFAVASYRFAQIWRPDARFTS